MNTPFNLKKPVAIGSDHAGFEYKEAIISFLDAKKMPPKMLAPIVRIQLTILILPIRLLTLLNIERRLLEY